MLLATARTGRRAELWSVDDDPPLLCRCILHRDADSTCDSGREDVEALVGVYSHDGSLLAVGMSSGLLEVRNGTNGELLFTLLGDVEPGTAAAAGSGYDDVTAVAFSSGSRYIATAGRAGTVRLWDAKAKRQIKSLHTGFPVRALAFTSKDSHVAVAGESEVVLLYSLTTNAVVMKLSRRPDQGQDWDPDSSLQALAFSPSKKSLLAAVDDVGQVTVWDVARKVDKAPTPGASRFLYFVKREAHDAPCTALTFVPKDPSLFYTAGFDKKIVCFDTRTRKILYEIQCEEPLTSLAFSFDGLRLGAATTGGRILIFESNDGGWSAPPDRVAKLVLEGDPQRALSFLAFSSAEVQIQAGTPTSLDRLQNITPSKNRTGQQYLPSQPAASERTPATQSHSHRGGKQKFQLLSPTAQSNLQDENPSLRPLSGTYVQPDVDVHRQDEPSPQASEPPRATEESARRTIQFGSTGDDEQVERSGSGGRRGTGPANFGSGEAVAGDLSDVIIRGYVEDVVEEVKQDLRSDILNLHTEVICQFDNQTSTLATLLKEFNDSQTQVRAEIEFLRRENRELRNLLGASASERTRAINI